MIKLKRKIYLAITAIALAAMALPVIGVKVGAAGGGLPAKAVPAAVPAAPTTTATAGPVATMGGGNSELGLQRAARKAETPAPDNTAGAQLPADILNKAFGITRTGGDGREKRKKKREGGGTNTSPRRRGRTSQR